MKFIEHLYVSKSIKNVDKVKSKLKRNVGQIMVYITAISENPTEQLDIYHCSILQQKYFHKNCGRCQSGASLGVLRGGNRHGGHCPAF